MTAEMQRILGLLTLIRSPLSAFVTLHFCLWLLTIAMAEQPSQNAAEDSNKEAYDTTPIFKYHHKKSIESVSRADKRLRSASVVRILTCRVLF